MKKVLLVVAQTDFLPYGFHPIDTCGQFCTISQKLDSANGPNVGWLL